MMFRVLLTSILCILYVFPNSVYADTFLGEISVGIFDYFKENKSTKAYFLKEGETFYRLLLPKTIDKNKLQTGDKVRVDGNETLTSQEKSIQVNRITLTQEPSLQVTPAAPNLDTRTIVVLMINFTDQKATNYLGAPDLVSMLYTSPRSMHKNFAVDSFNQVNFIADANRDGIPDIYSVNLNYAVGTTCDPFKWATDARAAATAQGINLALYQHNMFVIAPSVNCPWGGLGIVGAIGGSGCASSCYTWLHAYNPTQVYSQLSYTHELGHNLGLNHSTTDSNNDGVFESEYGDAACIMGTGDFLYYKEMNAPHRDQLHWFDTFAGRIRTAIGTNQYTLYPLESGVASGGLLALKVPKNSTQTYYLSYRKNIGSFGPGAPVQLDKVSIHYLKSDLGNTFSYFIGAFGTGATFTDTTNKVTINVISAGGDTATVNVSTLNTPQLTTCTFSVSKTTLTCQASNGGLLSLGSSIYQQYSGLTCALNGQIINTPTIASISDTSFITNAGVSPLVVGCTVTLCNNSSCTGINTSPVMIMSGV